MSTQLFFCSLKLLPDSLICCPVLLGLEETAINRFLLAFFLPLAILLIPLMPPLLTSCSNGRALLDKVVSGAKATRYLWLSSLMMHRRILMHLSIFSSSAVAFWMWGEAHSIQHKKHLLPLKSMYLSTAILALPISHRAESRMHPGMADSYSIPLKPNE